MWIINLWKRHKKQEYCISSHIEVLSHEITRLRRLLMATKQDVLAAIAAEKTQVLEAITELENQIQALKDQIAAGTPVTEADLDDIVSAVNDVFIPAPPVEPPTE